MDDLVRDSLLFSSHVRRDGNEYHGYIYFGSEIVFDYCEPVEKTPAGIEDFAHILEKKFAIALRNTLMGARHES